MIAFSIKDWRNAPSTSTPISAEALEDLEDRLSGYTDERVDPVESGGRTAVTQEAPLNLEWPEYADLREVDGISAGVDDWLPAFQAAQAALPDYVGGVGGGDIYIPGASIREVSDSIVLDSGQKMHGDGMRQPIIKGDFAGPVITTATDGGSNPITLFPALEDLFIWNASTNVAARTIDMIQTSHFRAKRLTCQGVAAGGSNGRLHAAILSDLDHCLFGGAAGADVALLIDNNSHDCTLQKLTCSDSKTGARVLLSACPVFINPHMEALAGLGGGSNYNAAIAISQCNGGYILGGHFESCPITGIAFSPTTGITFGFVVGGVFMTNMGSPFIDLNSLQQGTILPNQFTPGANSPNANGVNAGAATSIENVIYPQKLTSGSGAAVSVTGGGRAVRLDQGSLRTQGAAATDVAHMSQITGEAWQRFHMLADGKIFRGDGTASPNVTFEIGAGAPAAARANGSLYQRTDGSGTTDNLYIRRGGAWVGIA